MVSESSKIGDTRPFLLVLCFLTSFLVSVNGIRWLTSGPYVSGFAEKLTVFESQKDEYNLLFIGSSHYRDAIDPRLLDRLTAEAGYPTRSFNFCLAGIHLPEILHLLRRVHALKPARLKWVIIEPRLRVHFLDENIKNQRLIYYHDIPATVMALKCIHHRAEPIGGRFPQYWLHLQHFGYRLTNHGLARSLMVDLLQESAPARNEKIEQVRSLQGFEPKVGSNFSPASKKVYERRVWKYASAARKPALKPGMTEQLAELVREIEAMGARPIFLFAPVFEEIFELEFPPDSPPVDIVRLDDVERYPELFDIENRWDVEHMNTAGAELTTTAAAEAFLRIATGDEKY